MLKNGEIIDKMSLEQKAKMTIGKDYLSTQNHDEWGIPSIKMTDGPNGLRVQRKKCGDNFGIAPSETAVCFPTGAGLANTWNKHLAYLYGKNFWCKRIFYT